MQEIINTFSFNVRFIFIQYTYKDFQLLFKHRYFKSIQKYILINLTEIKYIFIFRVFLTLIEVEITWEECIRIIPSSTNHSPHTNSSKSFWGSVFISIHVVHQRNPISKYFLENTFVQRFVASHNLCIVCFIYIRITFIFIPN